MSMTNASAREMRQLREVAHFLLPLVCCEFCGKPLLKHGDKIFGNKTHSPLKKLRLTVHHRDGDHDNNKRRAMKTSYPGGLPITIAISGNLSLTHADCHDRYEMKKTRKKGKLKGSTLRERAMKRLKVIEGNPVGSGIKKLTDLEVKFFDNIWSRLEKDETKTVTLKEFRRLKKLAAKVKGEK